MSAKHSPGPWQADTIDEGSVWSADNTLVVDVLGITSEEQAANTALIVAAPELADALEESLELFSLGMSAGHPLSHGGYQKEADAIHERIRAALKKAGR